MALTLTFILGAFFMIGMLVIKFAPNHEVVEHISYAVAFGSMAAIIVLDLLPEILEVFEPAGYWKAALLVLLGIGLLKGIDIFIPEHEEADEENPVHIGIMATVAIFIHNVIEGMTVCSITMVDDRKGLVLALGVGLHNIPMGMLIYSALRPEKRPKKYLLMLLACISTFLGGCLMTGISSASHEFLESTLMCLAMGMIIFIVVFELAPLLLREKSKKWNLAGIFLGISIVLASSLLE